MWSAADLRGTAAAIAPWWALLTAHVPAEVAASLRPPQLEPFFPAAPDATGKNGSFGVEEVEAALEALSHAGREVAARGYGMAPQAGRVDGLFLGSSGLPKEQVQTADVTRDGLVGDRQRTRKHHGRVWQALCLWSSEVVSTLVDEGHPVFPGACGENVLLGGIDWAALRPGARLRMGTVLAEVSLPTIPCKQIRPYFSGAAIRRVDHDRYPGSSRWYATVLEPGTVAVGDLVEVEPQ